MKTRLYISVVFLLFVLLSGCQTVRTMKNMYGGKARQIQRDTVHFRQETHLIFVEAKINNQPKKYHFVFDTGGLTAISEKLANELDLPPTCATQIADPEGGNQTSRFVELQQLQVGKNSVENLKALTLDLSFYEQRTGLKIDGILGNNFLRFFALSLDYQQHELIFFSPKGYTPPAGSFFKYKFDQSLTHSLAPMVICKVDSFFATGIIDTGARGMISLPLGILKHLNYPLDSASSIKSKGEMMNGAFSANTESYLLQAKSFSMDALKIQNLVASTNHSDVLILGNEFLSRFKTILNYPRKTMFLYPKSHFNHCHNEFSSGLALQKQTDGNFTVVGIWQGSPADSAGIAPGDQVIQINQKDAKNISMLEFYALNTNPQTASFEIVVNKNQKRQRIFLRKKFLFSEN